MSSETERKMIADYCQYLFKDQNLAGILAETTCKQIENGLLTFPDFVTNALRKSNLSDTLRKRLLESLSELSESS